MPSHDLDIDPVDLSEAPRLAKDSYSRGTVIGGVCVAILFLALLVYGSLPELSPTEIVSMDGYAGERPTKHIFNLQSLDEGTKPPAVPAESVPAVAVNATAPVAVEAQQQAPAMVVPMAPQKAPQNRAVAQTPAPVAPVVQPAARATIAVAKTPTSPIAAVQAPSAVLRETKPVDPVAVVTGSVKTPAVPVSNAVSQQRVVAAMASTPKLTEVPTTVVVSSAVASEPAPMPIKRTEYKYAELARGPALASVAAGGIDSADRRLLPVQPVLNDYTDVKKSPSEQAKTLVSLGRGVMVTVFERQGYWVHIGTNDGSSITGYVLESEIGEFSRSDR